jgi:periplasmic protein TonB
MSDLDTGHKSSRRLWVCAAVGALLLHIGGAAFALTQIKGDATDGGLGADGAEIAIEMASPKVPDDDLPAGEDSDASKASPALPDQKAEVAEADRPKDIPTETDDPDRVVTTNDSKKPKEEEEKVAAVQTQASQESVEQAASSRKALDEKAPEAEKAKAPNVGIGKDRDRLTADWGRKISAYFKLHQRYPDGRRKAATVKIALVLSRLGHVLSVDVIDSSGDAAFDEAAVAMVRRSDPVPKPPAALKDDEFSFNLPVVFNAPK